MSEMGFSAQTPMVFPQIQPIKAAGLEVVSVNAKVIVAAMFFYNHILTSGDEINFVWLSRWNIGTVIYVITRYLTAAILIYTLSIKGAFVRDIARYFHDPRPEGCWGYEAFSERCRFVPICTEERCNFSAAAFTGDGELRPNISFDVLRAQPSLTVYPTKALFYTGTIVAFCSLCLLQIRTYALYDKSRMIKYLFCALDVFVLAEKVLEATMIRSIKHETFRRILEQSPTASGGMHHYSLFASRERATNVYTPFFWVPFALVESVTFGLVLRRAWPTSTAIRTMMRRWRRFLGCHRAADQESENRNQANFKQPAIFRNIVRDNFVYFFGIFVVYTSGVILVLFDLYSRYSTLRTLSQLHLLSSIATTGILGPNLFLNLKKQYHRSRSVDIDSDLFHSYGVDLGSETALSSFFAIPGPEENTDQNACAAGEDLEVNDLSFDATSNEIELDTFFSQ